MKCKDCLYENCCNLREIAKDLTGCEGHGEERPPKEGEVKCYYCKEWVDRSEAFLNEKKYICFKCY